MQIQKVLLKSCPYQIYNPDQSVGLPKYLNGNYTLVLRPNPAKEILYVEFKEFQSAITEGQFVAWYIDDELIGSGVIS